MTAGQIRTGCIVGLLNFASVWGKVLVVISIHQSCKLCQHSLHTCVQAPSCTPDQLRQTMAASMQLPASVAAAFHAASTPLAANCSAEQVSASSRAMLTSSSHCLPKCSSQRSKICLSTGYRCWQLKEHRAGLTTVLVPSQMAGHNRR